MSSELARRIVVTLGALLVFRIGAYIPLPGTDVAAWGVISGSHSRGIFGLIDMPSGTAARQVAIFALGILPYVTSAILIQIASFGSSRLRALGAAGDRGRAKIAVFTLYLTIILAAFQAYGLAHAMEGVRGLVPQPGLMFELTTMLSLTAGTILLVWLANQITVRGIGNGLALMLTVGFLVEFPGNVAVVLERVREGYLPVNLFVVGVISAVIVTAVIVFVEGARLSIMVDYAKRVIGGATLEARSTPLLLKVNGAGVMPTVIAGWLIVVLIFGIVMGIGPDSPILGELGHGHPLFMVLFGVLVVLFALYYTAYLIDPDKMSAQLQAFGGAVRGIGTGDATAEYLDNVISRVTLLGAVYLALVFVVPEILIVYFGLPFFPGGAPFLIVVCAALDIGAQLKQELQLKAGG